MELRRQALLMEVITSLVPPNQTIAGGDAPATATTTANMGYATLERKRPGRRTIAGGRVNLGRAFYGGVDDYLKDKASLYAKAGFSRAGQEKVDEVPFPVGGVQYTRDGWEWRGATRLPNR